MRGTVVANIGLLVLLFGLDVRDLYFKTAWCGPFDAFAFTATGQVRLVGPPLQLADTDRRTSGWSSFQSSCHALYGADIFLELLGKNCTFGDPGHPHFVESVLLSAAVRTDAIAWACCKLLHIHRRPGICQERIVKRFLKRYNLEDRINVEPKPAFATNRVASTCSTWRGSFLVQSSVAVREKKSSGAAFSPNTTNFIANNDLILPFLQNAISVTKKSSSDAAATSSDGTTVVIRLSNSSMLDVAISARK